LVFCTTKLKSINDDYIKYFHGIIINNRMAD
jgi:hypothetical protein